MKIIVKGIGQDAVVKEIEKLELEDMQQLVGGLIQPIYFDDNTICWCNEEGKLYGLDVNIAITAEPLGDIVDTVHGDIFFTSDEEGEEGLNKEQIQSLLERINEGLCALACSDRHIVPIISLTGE